MSNNLTPEQQALYEKRRQLISAEAELYAKQNKLKSYDWMQVRYNEYKELGKEQPVSAQELHDLRQPLRDRIDELRNIIAQLREELNENE